MNLGAQPFLLKLTLLIALIFAIGCRPEEAAQAPSAAAIQDSTAVVDEPQESLPKAPTKSSSLLDMTIPPTPTLHPQATPVQIAEVTSEPLQVVAYDQTSEPIALDPEMDKGVATAVPALKCAERLPGSDLLAIVTKEYGLSKDYAPDDLVALAEHLPYHVTVGYPSEIRQVALQPLVGMIDEMLAEGLQPQVLSGYRSYAAQAISWDKWNRLYPERAAIISAQPGHSEHQLGTVIDFGSPELPGLVGQPGIQFHTYFYKTSEGQWLAENAHRYGFTLSFTEKAFDTTGFYYEPWHFRYVGQPLAEQLREQNMTLTEYQLANKPPPCIP